VCIQPCRHGNFLSFFHFWYNISSTAILRVGCQGPGFCSDAEVIQCMLTGRSNLVRFKFLLVYWTSNPQNNDDNLLVLSTLRYRSDVFCQILLAWCHSAYPRWFVRRRGTRHLIFVCHFSILRYIRFCINNTTLNINSPHECARLQFLVYLALNRQAGNVFLRLLDPYFESIRSSSAYV